MTRRTLADLLVLGARPIYDSLYRRGAPWEGGPRAELVDLAATGRIGLDNPGARVIDLGCGSGSSSIHLAGLGFDVVGVDLSPVAIDKARAAADLTGVRPEFVVADLMDLPPELSGPYDLLLDGGTIDDFPPSHRRQVVTQVTSLTRPGSMLLKWCFFAHHRDLPALSFSGPSRWGAPSIEPRELDDLYAQDWTIEPVSGGPADGFACFLLTRR